MVGVKGLLYMKHGRLGTKSEGPDYFLQTRKTDYLLNKNVELWEPDYRLEFYCRRMVEVTGEIDGQNIKVTQIKEINTPFIPED